MLPFKSKSHFSSCSAKEVKKAPVILEKLQNSGVPEGHPVRLEGRVIGMPPPVFYWKKDNETIPFTRERIRYSSHHLRGHEGSEGRVGPCR